MKLAPLPDTSAEEAHELRRCIRDLMGLLALPAIWSGKDGQTILGILLNSLSAVVPTEFCLAVGGSGTGPRAEILNIRGKAVEFNSPDWDPIVAVCRSRPITEKSLLLEKTPLGRLQITRVDLGVGARHGSIWLGSSRIGFPSLTQLTFLRALSSLGDTGLQVSRLLAERDLAEAKTQRINEQYRFLIDLDDATRPLVDARTIALAAARMLGTHLSANRCAYADVESDQDTFNLSGDYTNGVASIVGRYTFSAFGNECLKSMRAGAPFIVVDAESDSRTALIRESYRATEIRAVICVPLIKEGQLVAAMAVHQNTPRTWAEHEVELLQGVASRCWESIERTRLARAAENALRESDRRKDEFLAMLAHELRNPLAPIRNAAQLLKLLNIDHRVRQTGEIISRQVDHMTGLVNDLLDVSRVTRGMVALNKENVNVRQLVAEAIEQTRPLFDLRHHVLILEDSSEPLYVCGDQTRLVQVVTNLLNNAAKFTQEGGRIELSLGNKDDNVLIGVKDNGAGIKPEFLPRIFDLFSQGSRSSDRSQGGLGLGLALVKTLVTLHDGSVNASSQGEGKGAEFLVRLPRTSPPKVAYTSSEVIPGRSGASLRILVVDDNVDAANTLADLLRAESHIVRVEYHSSEALDRARSESYDVIMLDIGLPGIDGHELAREIRRSLHLRKSFLIAVTGYGSAEDRKKSKEAGFDLHFVKPVNPEALRSAVADLKARRSEAV